MPPSFYSIINILILISGEQYILEKSFDGLFVHRFSLSIVFPPGLSNRFSPVGQKQTDSPLKVKCKSVQKRGFKSVFGKQAKKLTDIPFLYGQKVMQI